MLLQIFQGTPLRIWILLAGLVVLGVWQARPRTIAPARAAVLPAALLVLSLAGVVSTFGASAPALAAWAAGIAAALAIGPRVLPPVDATWSATHGAIRVAGSWLPLALILGLFATKYVAGVSLALHPDLAAQARFAILCGLAYGLFSGVFAARGWQLWRIRAAVRG